MFTLLFLFIQVVHNPPYHKILIQGRVFSNKHLNVIIFKYVVDGIDERQINWRHYVREQNRGIGLDENESGQAPNASD